MHLISLIFGVFLQTDWVGHVSWNRDKTVICNSMRFKMIKFYNEICTFLSTNMWRLSECHMTLINQQPIFQMTTHLLSSFSTVGCYSWIDWANLADRNLVNYTHLHGSHRTFSTCDGGRRSFIHGSWEKGQEWRLYCCLTGWQWHWQAITMCKWLSRYCHTPKLACVCVFLCVGVRVCVRMLVIWGSGSWCDPGLGSIARTDRWQTWVWFLKRISAMSKHWQTAIHNDNPPNTHHHHLQHRTSKEMKRCDLIISKFCVCVC